ncbi:MAG TPA: uroporphyrinogen decarboxylase family protein [Anaerolineales bacterium]|nr:uroporphyrinogen decarboxylase family protein [Anaerolineales bacterium]HNC89171.1 uroporphyrinogen decarboxylase family protein [Anaerolineales bacterium]HNF34895.1 uroporphyrinogen decarboxylase family protein [Anaerolineales bacterium]HNH04374.1 uroporphyrinogen decarboxylase family protein [Anaerolineales bacterium]HUM26347.1 uroporphyrinogen decarboxylase family protein [Anaerolineales bacterium]
MTTHRERIQASIEGKKTDRTPIALWRHFPVDDQNPETLAASTLHFQQTYDFDIVKVTPASSFAVKDWGVEDKWMGDSEGSRRYTKRVIHKPEDWEKLTVLDPTSPHLAGQLTCLRLIRENLGPDTPLIQTIFNPLSQAKNLASNDTLVAHIRQHPEAVMKGLETIARTTAKFIEAAAEIGIDGIFYAVQHAQANLLSVDEYTTFGLPYDQQALFPVKNLWCNMLHLHGKDVYFSLLRLLNFQIVNWHDRETHPSLAEAHSLFKGVLCGGLRQDTLVLEDQAKIKEEAADAIQQTKSHRFILGTGCVVPITASHGNLLVARKSVE